MSNVHWAQAELIRYAVPRPSELPQTLVPWRADPRRSVLLVHDMQRYFVRRFASDGEPGSTLVDSIARAIDVARRTGVPIIYTAQPGSMTVADRGLLADLWGPGMTVSAEERDVVQRLAPRPEDLVLTKWRYSAFVRSPLAQHLESLGRDQVVLCGIYAHVGVLATALDAYSRDLETFVLADAVADFDRDQHLRALEHLARTAARVCPTDDVVASWAADDEALR